jgi:hypothetical protein
MSKERNSREATFTGEEVRKYQDKASAAMGVPQEFVFYQKHLEETLKRRVTMAPSCMQLNWEWQAVPMIDARSLAAARKQPLEEDIVLGWNIRCSFERPDTKTGKMSRGWGRWWFVGEGTSDTGIIKTAWLAMRQIVEHEMMEAFLVDGVRIFNPHRSVQQLKMGE